MNKVLALKSYQYFKQQAQLGYSDYVLPPAASSVPSVTQPQQCSAAHNTQSAQESPEHIYQMKRRALVDLFYEVRRCHGCSLGVSRKKLVFGAGNANAPVMIIGEAPGEEEDREGLPFVGKAGALLTKMIEAIDLDREKDIFITNVLKCRPPANRNPNQSEMLACAPILKRQISIIKPCAILALGRIAAHELLNKPDTISSLRNEIHFYNDSTMIVTYHPAALLRNAHYKRPAWEDLQKFQKILKEKGVYDRK